MGTFVGMLLRMLLLVLILVVPMAAAVFFLVSLTRFLKTDKADTELRQENKTYLWIASCIMGVIGLAITVLWMLTMLSMSHM